MDYAQIRKLPWGNPSLRIKYLGPKIKRQSWLVLADENPSKHEGLRKFGRRVFTYEYRKAGFGIAGKDLPGWKFRPLYWRMNDETARKWFPEFFKRYEADVAKLDADSLLCWEDWGSVKTTWRDPKTRDPVFLNIREGQPTEAFWEAWSKYKYELRERGVRLRRSTGAYMVHQITSDSVPFYSTIYDMSLSGWSVVKKLQRMIVEHYPDPEAQAELWEDVEEDYGGWEQFRIHIAEKYAEKFAKSPEYADEIDDLMSAIYEGTEDESNRDSEIAEMVHERLMTGSHATVGPSAQDLSTGCWPTTELKNRLKALGRAFKVVPRGKPEPAYVFTRSCSPGFTRVYYEGNPVIEIWEERGILQAGKADKETYPSMVIRHLAKCARYGVDPQMDVFDADLPKPLPQPEPEPVAAEPEPEPDDGIQWSAEVETDDYPSGRKRVAARWYVDQMKRKGLMRVCRQTMTGRGWSQAKCTNGYEKVGLGYDPETDRSVLLGCDYPEAITIYAGTMKWQESIGEDDDRFEGFKAGIAKTMKLWEEAIKKKSTKPKTIVPQGAKYTGDLAKKLRSLKKELGADSVRQGYRGTGSASASRQIVINFPREDKMIDVWLETHNAKLGGVYARTNINVLYNNRSVEEVYVEIRDQLSAWLTQ
jgi:hypothetical protein